jgi:hypothetical protein
MRRPPIPAGQNSGPSRVAPIRPPVLMPVILEAELVELLAQALLEDLRTRPVRSAKPVTAQGNREATVGPPGRRHRSRVAPVSLEGVERHPPHGRPRPSPRGVPHE